MARLALPIGTLKDHCAVVVIGSGYGATITASRLARAGKQVCVLERIFQTQRGLDALASHPHHVSPGIKRPRTKSSLSSKPRPGLSETRYFPPLITGPS